MMARQQDCIAVVLVRARNPFNIGAVARAMHDFGFADLRVVNEYAVPFAAAKSAVDASTVLDAAREYTSVADAIADCTLVLGTTAVGDRALEHPLHTLAEAAGLIDETIARQESARVALLFGSEKTGLSNEELSHCHALLTIPMNTSPTQRHLSMNLGQAVAVCLYELVRGAATEVPFPVPARKENSVEGRSFTGADAGSLERLGGLLNEVLERSGYARRHPANAREANVRRLVRRMGLAEDDAAVWSGILRQMLYALDREEH